MLPGPEEDLEVPSWGSRLLFGAWLAQRDTGGAIPGRSSSQRGLRVALKHRKSCVWSDPCAQPWLPAHLGDETDP